ncbi:MAG: YHS domain-containing protein [Acidobacteria bacterium]|nr:YHS domain-containing protein [Acidobacteriota bacterium]
MLRLLQILLVLLIVRALWRLWMGIRRGLHEHGAVRGGGAAVPLFRDPVCGTYVVPGRALALRDGGLVRYFCSERCRDEFARAPRDSR